MPIENLGHWCGMLYEKVIVDISSERDSPVVGVTIEEEVEIMWVGSSSVPKKKRGAPWPMSPVQKKQHSRTSTQPQEEAPTQTGPSNILGYVPPKRPDVNPRKMTENSKYPMKMVVIL